MDPDNQAGSKKKKKKMLQERKATLPTKAKSVKHSVVSHLFATPWTVARQAPLSVGFSRQGYWSGLPFPSPGDLPNPGMECASLMSPASAGGFFSTGTTGEAQAPVLTECLFCARHPPKCFRVLIYMIVTTALRQALLTFIPHLSGTDTERWAPWLISGDTQI